MKTKLIFCLALVCGGLIVAAGLIWHQRGNSSRGISLSGSTNQIRAAILKITPIGTSIEEVKTNILEKLQPEGFDIRTLPNDKKQEQEIICQIGYVFSHWYQFFAEEITARWVFENENRLTEVFVEKKTEVP